MGGKLKKKAKGKKKQNHGERVYTSVSDCFTECDEATCVGFNAYGEIDDNVTCEYFSEIYYLADYPDVTVYHITNRTLENLWAIVDDCLENEELSRYFILNELLHLNWRKRRNRCRNYPSAMYCIMRGLHNCLDFDDFAQPIWYFLEQFHTNCRFWQYPGFCPAVAPDCPDRDVNVTTCRFYSYSGSWSDGTETFSWEWSWGYDRDCPMLHKCCDDGDDSNELGVCVRANVPEEGCDPDKAAACRAQIFTPDVKFRGRTHFCANYLEVFRDCVTSHTTACSQETLDYMDYNWGFRAVLRALLNMIAVCGYTPCNPDPCNGNGQCINRYDGEPTIGDEELDLWEASRREWDKWRNGQAWECQCEPYFRGLQCEIPECPKYDVSLGHTSLFFLSGFYDLMWLPFGFGWGYRCRGGSFFMVTAVHQTVFYSMSTGEAILIINSVYRVTFVLGGFGIDILLNSIVSLSRACEDGRGYFYEFGWHIDDEQFLFGFGSYPAAIRPLETPVQIGCESYSKMCIYMDGFVTFTNDICPHPWFALYGSSVPFPSIAQPQFCIFCGFHGIHPFSSGIVYFGYHLSQESTNIHRATEDMRDMGFTDFTARQVWVVTWYRISPLMAVFLQAPLTNTFQMVFISDFTRFFVLYYHGQMFAGSQIYYTSSLGVYLQMGIYGQGVSLYDVSSVANGDRGVYIATQGNKVHASGRRFWFFDVTGSNCPVSLTPCQQWILDESIDAFEHDTCPVDVCPPSELLAVAQGYRCDRTDPGFALRTCYVIWTRVRHGDWRDKSMIRVKSLCCYPKSELECGADSTSELFSLITRSTLPSSPLITTPDRAGVTQYYRMEPVTWTWSWTYRGQTYSGSYDGYSFKTNDMDGWDICCNAAGYIAGDCALYYNFRRIAITRCFIPRFIAWLRGDPHFTTIDGLTYTFNGWGEYVMAKTRDEQIEIQVRTELVTVDVADQTVFGNATKFSGIVIYHNGSQTVQFELEKPHDADTGMLMFGNGVPMDEMQTTLTFGTTSVTRHSDKSVRVTVDGDWNIDIQVANGMMLFVVSVPESQRGNIVGLLGTFTNDTSDDFERPDGTNLDTNATAREKHDRFGQQWATTSETSRFTYFGGDTWETYSHPDFEPYFGDEAPDAEAVAICGDDKECIYDYQATKNRDVAMATANINKNVQQDMDILANNAPTLTVSNGSSVALETGKSAYLIVEVNDVDGDDVKVDVAPGYRTTCITSITGDKVGISTHALSECDLALIAIETGGYRISSAVTQVAIVECPACENGYCDHATAERLEGAVNQFHKKASCTCNLGWQGTTCTERVDPCSANPCGERDCEVLTEEELDLAQNNQSRGYRCKCLFEEISVAGNCFLALPTNETVIVEEDDDDDVSREMIIVIAVCGIVIFMGIGVVVIYVTARMNLVQRRGYRRPTPTSTSGSRSRSFHARRMNLGGWWPNSGGYGWNPATPNPYSTPQPYMYRSPASHYAYSRRSPSQYSQPQAQMAPAPRPQFNQNQYLGRGWNVHPVYPTRPY